MEMEKKLLLEKVFGLYIDNDIEVFSELMSNKNFADDAVSRKRMLEFIKLWKDVRLEISGGDKSNMGGDVGMASVMGFLYEIENYDNLMHDYEGMYRGDARYECRDFIFDLLDGEIEDVEFRNEVKNKYDEYFEIEELF
jgi:hypothetical protein